MMYRILILLLFISLFAFALDLFHMIYHLSAQPKLWQIETTPVRLSMKVLAFLIPVLFLLFRKRWSRAIGILIFVAVLFHPAAFAANCQHAREMFEQGGVSRDASENFLGQLKVVPPHGSFPPDIDKMTWWGTFQPFEFWSNPEFQAVWINPKGEEVARNKFRAGKCKLAKNTLRAENQPRGEFEGGMWNVIVTCDDYLIHKQQFAVMPANRPPAYGGGQDPGKRAEESAMIWAEKEVKE